MHGIPLYIRLPDFFFKMLKNDAVNWMEELKKFDPQYYDSMMHLREMDDSTLEDLGTYFEQMSQNPATTVAKPLSQANVDKFIEQQSKLRLYLGDYDQYQLAQNIVKENFFRKERIDAILKGFQFGIPPNQQNAFKTQFLDTMDFIGLKKMMVGMEFMDGRIILAQCTFANDFPKQNKEWVEKFFTSDKIRYNQDFLQNFLIFATGVPNV